MSFLKQSNANAAATILGGLKKRNMEGYFCETSKEAVEKALSLMPEGSVISWGGSMTLSECGLMDAIRGKNYTLIDRMTAVTPQEKREIYAKTVMADYYLMSTNAITMDGELVNIDGFCNRVACLCAGPENVIVIAGMNKVVGNVESGLDRIRTKAAPANTTRLKKKTPCASTGVCGSCFSPDCICSQTVITRRSGIPGRIKVILVNEDLGY
ncbi:MAG: lactate utilization protein [Clostridiales bacterium]|nr:lactate utilization protein [Clostridiales bacterium]